MARRITSTTAALALAVLGAVASGALVGTTPGGGAAGPGAVTEGHVTERPGPPGHGGTPPGHGGTPPGHGVRPPGHGGTPPGHGRPPVEQSGAINAFHTVVREQAELDGYTVYRPTDVPHGAELPVVLWGNGACVASNITYIPFLTNVAKHGFVVIAVGDADAPVIPAPFPPPPTITGDALLEALDWLSGGDSSQLADADETRVATMGHSCGGTEALTASLDDRVSSTVAWSSSSGPGVVDRELLAALRTPAMWVAGGESDHAHVRSVEAFDNAPANLPAVLVINELAGHGLFFDDLPGVGEAGRNMATEGVELAVHWLDLTLNGNADAADFFLTGDAPLTDLEGWSVESRSGGG